MKNTFAVTALAAVLGLALAGVPVTLKAQSTNAAPAPATAPATSTTAKASKKTKYTQYSGTLKTLDAASAVVTTKSGDITLAIDATTTFHVNKKKAAATDFAVGDSVTGSYATGADGTTLTAHTINKKKK